MILKPLSRHMNKTVPFFEAYSRKATAIECDSCLVKGSALSAGHDRETLRPPMPTVLSGDPTGTDSPALSQ